jgi:hypothetical protein
MSTAFAFAYESLRKAALQMTRQELIEEMNTINEELNYISSLLHFYEEGDELYIQNLTHGKFLIQQRMLYEEVYFTRSQEFQQEVEDEMYDMLDQLNTAEQE